MRSRFTLACLAALMGPATLVAQTPVEAPLSVIDWLDSQAATPAALPQPTEPDVTSTATVPQVSVAPLDGAAPRRVGLAPANVTGLPDTLWSGSDGTDLARTIAIMPDLRQPALQSLFYTLLLAESLPPAQNATAFDLARIDALYALGALDPAMALLQQAGPDASAAHMARYMDMALLTGSEAAACATLRAQPHLSPGPAHEVFCAARAGDWDTAVLILGTGRALGLMDETTVAALERFLDPDLFEDAAPLPVPTTPDTLMFRVFQAIGTPIPTRGWPVVYANADLANTVGWKARIEAGERLARTGAVADNRLLGLYTHRQPAASGGVWDRVSALQRVETALGQRSVNAVAKTLPGAWRAMRSARLTAPFASLFANDLAALTLSGPSADIAFEVLLLSPQYETAAQIFPQRALDRPVLAAVASGTVPADLTGDGAQGAILAAFGDAAPDAGIIASAQDGDLGHAILRTLALTHAGGAGDVAQLRTGLATLRALGLEDVARRAALQVLLLEEPV
ncbi:hypothetical protein [uncultured Tateyamaria sp.]|uniref:hypothetical protein n=1 Tax=uncultured Tateyamaria sp. TaxID=455651 RepID=UPI0026173561|nr:hypothetical protein [uncultured Tateyamaria sp.]